MLPGGSGEKWCRSFGRSIGTCKDLREKGCEEENAGLLQ